MGKGAKPGYTMNTFLASTKCNKHVSIDVIIMCLSSCVFTGMALDDLAIQQADISALAAKKLIRFICTKMRFVHIVMDGWVDWWLIMSNVVLDSEII